jgi:hypothetical protein
VRNVHDDKLQNSRSRKDQERPLDRPDALVCGGDGGVYDPMGMALGMVMIVPIMVVPLRAEA